MPRCVLSPALGPATGVRFRREVNRPGLAPQSRYVQKAFEFVADGSLVTSSGRCSGDWGEDGDSRMR